MASKPSKKPPAKKAEAKTEAKTEKVEKTAKAKVRQLPDDQKLAVVDIPANEPYPTGGVKEK